MRWLGWSALAFAGLTLVFIVVEARERLPAPSPESATPSVATEPPAALPHPEGVSTAVPVTRSRQVGAVQIAPPPVDPGRLERVEPRAPLSELALALPPRKAGREGWQDRLLHRPVAEAAGLIAVAGHRIAVHGIDILDADETCQDAAGRDWPCGRMARTAFRGWLRGRAIACDVPEEPADDLVTARCVLGNDDVAEWLVRNGWATVATGSAYAEAAAKAKEGRAGIFGVAPGRN